MMATCSTDEYIKIWDIAHNNGTEPKLIGAKKTTMVTTSLFLNLFRVSSSPSLTTVTSLGSSQQVALRERSQFGTQKRMSSSRSTSLPSLISQRSP